MYVCRPISYDSARHSPYRSKLWTSKQEYITKILCPKIVLRSASKIEM